MEHDMRGVLRALAVLKELNIENGASILRLHQTTGISRAALYRIVRTLQSAGYLAIDDNSQSLRLTPLVKQLSEGYEEDAWISEIAGPILDRLQQQVIWPTDLFSFFDDTMVMRRTTRRASPWTFDRALIGLRIPMTSTACGRAYLSHVPAPVLDGVLERLAQAERLQPSGDPTDTDIRGLLDDARKNGFALRDVNFMKETGSIAVPVLVDESAFCAIAITYINTAISAADAASRFAPLLKECAAQLAHELLARRAVA